MMSGFRKLRPGRPFLLLSLLAGIAFAAGCSTANNNGGGAANVNHVDASGNSVPGWLVLPTGGTHTASATLDYIANGGSSSCTQCHGSDLSGGISGVSCSQNPAGCHHGPVAGWVATSPAVQEHGVSAKRDPGSSGFAACQICHGKSFAGGVSLFSCYACHGVDAPHPAAPWRGSPYTHTDVKQSNAPVCAQCHLAGTAAGAANNPANHPATPAPAGTPPGCFNNTLCHGSAVAPHPLDNTWVTTPPAAQPHGNDAKAAPGATTGLAYCQECHGSGTDFAGGSSGVSCYTCHGVNAPHPALWLTADDNAYVHSSTDEGNATVCAFCHLNGANSPIAPPSPPAPSGTAPGCFNSTLCHGSVVPHPLGTAWVAPVPQDQPHGDSAKAAPGTAAGFAYCQDCHGTGSDFAGGSSGVSCYPCHGGSSPHPAQWRTGDDYVHTSTDQGNAAVCAFCHLDGANSPVAPPSPPAPSGTAPGCFNSTLCHGSVAVAHPVPFNSTAHYGVTTASFPGNCGACHDISGTTTKSGPICQTCHIAASPLTALNCTSCHAAPPDGGVPAGAAYPNIAGAHATHLALNGAGSPVACDTCHTGLGSGTLNHYNRANARPGSDALRVPPGDAAFTATYAAQSGASSFDNSAALSCSNVSCHGGQATPNWQTGTIDVNNACTNCHASGTAQYNSYSSGRHSLHLSTLGTTSTTCKLCHNTTALAAAHFTTLSDNTISPAVAAATVGGTGTSITSFTPGSGTTGTCLPACHGSQTW
jgi:predicted CxxxxCH...CXXCH cytochrome family protein